MIHFCLLPDFNWQNLGGKKSLLHWKVFTSFNCPSSKYFPSVFYTNFVTSCVFRVDDVVRKLLSLELANHVWYTDFNIQLFYFYFNVHFIWNTVKVSVVPCLHFFKALYYIHDLNIKLTISTSRVKDCAWKRNS